MRDTTIIETIGPAGRDPTALDGIITAGADVCRLNFPHGTRESHAESYRRIRQAAGRAGRVAAILQDLGGPEIRTGRLRHSCDAGAQVDDRPGAVVVFIRMSIARSA